MAQVSCKRKIGIAVLALAFVPYGIAYWHANRYNWTPLNDPVVLRPGEVRSSEFVSDFDGDYRLFLETQPGRIETQRLHCLLDVEFFHPERCAGIPHVVELSWTLWTDQRAVADNTSKRTWRALSVSNDSIRREIGRFHAQSGKRYVVAVNFGRDPSALNVARPKLVAEGMKDYAGFALEVQASFAIGVLAAIVALAMFAPSRK